ncbi:hypothetical protein CCHR01_19130 [Colletotrichum chrysophilum]|uniref:Uncharacterized protein n=1 Tax=Colletotrichum chrysophilum TaxID=1836956 RepID=A0AAD9E5E6_9PEZI|nr:hypothetical protein CCHR01_19130 [Colletotrichum chrysophilum]
MQYLNSREIRRVLLQLAGWTDQSGEEWLVVGSLRVGGRPRQIPMSLLSFRRARWTDEMAEMMDGRVKHVQVRLARMDSRYSEM